MFREMRKKDRELSLEEAKKIIEEQSCGVMSVIGDEGYPYGVPLNYGYVDGKFYIHCTSGESHKTDAIRKNPKVCMTIVAKSDLLKEKLTTDFASVVVFGKARIVTGAEEKMEAMIKMMEGLAPEMIGSVREHCLGAEQAYSMIEITPEHITGKARK